MSDSELSPLESPEPPVARLIERVFFHAAGFCLMALFSVMMGGVLFRYLPIQVSLEHWVPGLLNLLQVWLILFGSLAAVVSGHHLRIAFIVEQFPAHLRVPVNGFVWLLRVLTLATILYSSIAVVDKGFSASIGGVPFTKGLIYAALPVVLTLMLLLEMINVKGAIAKKKADAS